MSALTDFFTSLANKIRSKLGTSTTYTPAQAVSAIDDVYTKGVTDTKVGTAGVGDVLATKTFTNSTSVGAIGTMTNNGAVSPSGLNCGGSYTIPAGYHNGSGKVTANSLASQTGVDSGKYAAEAGTILSGYQAWVNGSKISGSMGNRSRLANGPQNKDTELNSSDNCPVYVTTEYYLADNKDGVRRLCLIPAVGKSGLYAEHNSAIAIAGTTLGNAGPQHLLSGTYASSYYGINFQGTIPQRGAGTSATISGNNGNPYVWFPYGWYPQVDENYGCYVYLSDAQAQALHKHTATITPTSNSSAYDMGEYHGYRYINTNTVYNLGVNAVNIDYAVGAVKYNGANSSVNIYQSMWGFASSGGYITLELYANSTYVITAFLCSRGGPAEVGWQGAFSWSISSGGSLTNQQAPTQVVDGSHFQKGSCRVTTGGANRTFTLNVPAYGQAYESELFISFVRMNR